jgi:phage tail protein X
MASQQYIVHVTRAGERWDLLAWRFYGDATKYGDIIVANPGVPIVPVFDAGVAVRIPLLAHGAALGAGLPPWKSAATAQGAQP